MRYDYTHPTLGRNMLKKEALSQKPKAHIRQIPSLPYFLFIVWAKFQRPSWLSILYSQSLRGDICVSITSSIMKYKTAQYDTARFRAQRIYPH